MTDRGLIFDRSIPEQRELGREAQAVRKMQFKASMTDAVIKAGYEIPEDYIDALSDIAAGRYWEGLRDFREIVSAHFGDAEDMFGTTVRRLTLTTADYPDLGPLNLDVMVPWEGDE